MRENAELKARCSDPAKVRAALRSLGAKPLGAGRQRDTYFRTARGRLKLREGAATATGLIYYDRPNSPTLRRSSFDIIPAGDRPDALRAVLTETLGVLAVVNKHRESFQIGAALINLDEVDGLGSFVEIEIDRAVATSDGEVKAIGARLRSAFGIEPADLVPWSYLELRIMTAQAAVWRERIAAQKAGRRAGEPLPLFLFDGASCSGKTTLLRRVLDDAALRVAPVPRYCTRSPRANEKTGPEYIFVDRPRFDSLATAGAFIEFRDFEFDISYGLPWQETADAVASGRPAVGIMNLGNVAHVRRLFPEAVTILIDAPIETIRRRLVARGELRDEEIDERLGNAVIAHDCRAHYHHVVENPDGALDAAFSRIREIILNPKPVA